MADRIVVVLGGGSAELTGRPAGATLDSSGACLVELGDRRAAFATGNFYAPVATTSHHLGPLRRAALVTSRRDGTRIGPDRRPPRGRPVRRGGHPGRPLRGAARPDATMTTTSTSQEQDRDAPVWTGDAVDYDAWFDTPWGHHAFTVESAAVRRACGDLAGRRLLDAGCGTGRVSATLVDHHTTVVGVDPDPAMLDLARTRTTAGCCARAAIEHLPFPDGAFDLTLAVTVLEFVAHPAAALAELARVTRNGGRIVIGALNPHSPWGLANRRRLRTGVWCHARFLSRSELQALGTPHGRTSLHGALYAPGVLPGLSRIGPLLETAGRAAPGWGAFQVLAIDKDRHP